jgi:hypothetical protein
MKRPRKKTILAVSVALAGSSAAFSADTKPAESPAQGGNTSPPARSEPARSGATEPLVQDFNQARQEYLAKRNAVKQSQRGSNEAQRQALREKIQTQRDQQARTREELRQQLQEKREQLPSHRDLIDDARERGRERPRRGD